MAGSSLLALIDDIATLLDDVAVMTKVATQKTAGVLGDDLALNAQQVTGVNAAREIPVVLAVAKGSLINKAILVPLALLISAFIPWAIAPLLMVGGAFLCYEGFEKVFHKLFHAKGEAQDEEAEYQQRLEALGDPAQDMVAFEKAKIKGAIRTDFILSAEIVVIALGTFEEATIVNQIIALTIIAVVMTVGVYGIVGGIVKLDDLGLYLSKKQGALATIGGLILKGAPWLMKGLALVGTVAMFLVGGGILAHGLPGGEHFIHELAEQAGPVGFLVSNGINALVGIVAGGVVMAAVTGITKVVKAVRKPA